MAITIRGPILISIHAPRVGSDEASAETCAWYKPFQSTLPGWGATQLIYDIAGLLKFQSTLPGWGATGLTVMAQNAPFEFQSTLPGWGATQAPWQACREYHHFNPRSPGGERLTRRVQPTVRPLFQSTLPGWGATAKMDIFAHDMGKIIHFQH